MKDLIQKFIDDEGGLTIVEYAVAGALIVAGAVVAFQLLGDNVTATINGIAGEIAPPAQ